MISCVKGFEYKSVFKKTQTSKTSSSSKNILPKGDDISAVEEVSSCSMEMCTKEETILDSVKPSFTMSQAEADFLFHYLQDRFLL